jgi:hypothetical protein
MGRHGFEKQFVLKIIKNALQEGSYLKHQFEVGHVLSKKNGGTHEINNW